MLSRWWQKLAYFPFSDPIARRQAPLLLITLLTLAALALLRLPLALAGDIRRVGLLPALISDGVAIVCPLLALALLRRGRFQAAVILTPVGTLITIAAGLTATGMANSGALPLVLALPVVFVGLLGNWRGLLFISSVGAAIVISVTALEKAGSPLVGFASAPGQPVVIATNIMLILLLLSVLLVRFRQDYRQELQNALLREQELISIRSALLLRTQELEREIERRQKLETQLLQTQKLESIGRLAGGIAHDFNNLLTVISGTTDLLLEALPDDHATHQDLQMVREAAKRAADLTQQLLAFARKQLLQPRVIDLGQLAYAMDALLRRLLGAQIELITTVSPDLGRVRADPSQIEQVVANLCINARDAMPQGGVLTIEAENATLDDAYAAQHVGVTPGEYVLLTISDTGTGMDAQTLAQIFEPFFSTKAIGQNSGLGLATCYGIVKQHGGNIWAYSDPGQGSSFRVYLPKVADELQPVLESRATSTLARGSEVLMVVEDDTDVRLFIVRVLRGQGYTILEAASGDEALALARRWSGAPIDLLVTDVIMPRMNGKTLAEKLTLLVPKLSVLFISGHTGNVAIYNGQLNPAARLLEKPFSPAALAQAVRATLDAR